VNKLGILAILVKRDYAMQYAGAALGSLWFLIQGILIFFLYIYISDGLSVIRGYSSSKSVEFILSGVLFWIPLQEMIHKSTTVLTENRAIIKRSGVGLNIFYLIPISQMMIHFFILSIPAIIYLLFINGISIYSTLIFPWIFLTALFIYPFTRYISMANVLLKDISPIVRLLLQFGFWSLPILYQPPIKYQSILVYHPLLPFLEVFRAVLLSNYVPDINYNIFLIYIFLSISFYIVTRLSFEKIVPDHL
jgi:lipopolysaccharide transport system permease protein